jgi:sugar O-acyltransferase (sialic acid O-acetyltransferase NeuD family)
MAETSLTPLLIFGTGNNAECAYYYLTHDVNYKDRYQVVGFITENASVDTFSGLSVYQLNDIENVFNNGITKVIAPISGRNLNKYRERIFNALLVKGFEFISYISSKANVFTEKIGRNCFILEDNTIQPFVEIGDNCVIWSGNHIGHHSKLGNHIFMTSHIVISGLCNIGDYCYIGVNVSIRDSCILAPNTVIGMHSGVTKNTESYKIYTGCPAKIFKECDDTLTI